MIQGIVDILNAKLATTGRIDKRYCITEKRQSGDNNEMPYSYGGRGEYTPVDIGNPSLSWWRLTDRPSLDTIVGKYQVNKRTANYPLRLVVMFRRKDSTQDDTFSPSWLAEDIANLLTFDNGDLKTALKASKTKCRVTSTDIDSTRIWNEEFDVPVKDLDYRYALVSFDVSVEVEADLSCWENECEYDPDILHIFDFCDNGTFNRLTETQRTCLEEKLCGSPAPVTVSVNGVDVADVPSGDTYNVEVEDEAGNQVGTGANPSVVSNSKITINGASLGATGSVLAEANLDIDVVQSGVQVGSWNGSEWEITAVYPDVEITATTTTPNIGASVTLTATATGFTPDLWIWTIPVFDGVIEVSTAVNTYNWTVNCQGSFTIKVTAIDTATGNAAFGKLLGSVNVESETTALISALETTYGGSLGDQQKYCIDVFFKGWKGFLFEDAEDLSATQTASTRILLCVPQNDSTASVTAYSIDAFTATGMIPVNLVAGDVNTTGISGGTGKYIQMDIAPSSFGQNDVMQSTIVIAPIWLNEQAMGSTNMYLTVLSGNAFTIGGNRVNGTVGNMPCSRAWNNHNVSKSILIGHQRSGANAQSVWVDGKCMYYASDASVAPSSNVFRALNTNGYSLAGTRVKHCMFIWGVSWTGEQWNYFNRLMVWFNVNIITGGRLINP